MSDAGLQSSAMRRRYANLSLSTMAELQNGRTSNSSLAPLLHDCGTRLSGTFRASRGLAASHLKFLPRQPQPVCMVAIGADLRFAMISVATGAASTTRVAQVRSLYPVRAQLRDGTGITIRPIGPQDTQREQAFVQALSPESRYFRFMSTSRELPPETLHRFTHPDFDREVALVALIGDEPDVRQIGVGRCVAQEDRRSAEFAVVVADDWQSRGVGTRLMCELMRAARAAGFSSIWGDVLASNHRMLALMGRLGFQVTAVPEDALLRRVVKKLDVDWSGQKDFVHAT